MIKHRKHASMNRVSESYFLCQFFLFLSYRISTVLGAVAMAQKNEDEDQSESELLNMPVPVLQRIFIQLDDENLLNASNVCNGFAKYVEYAFARKYSKQTFVIHTNGLYINENTILNMYGGKMLDVKVVDVYEPFNWILNVIECKCLSLKRITLYKVPRMINLPNLVHIRLMEVRNITVERFIEFLNINSKVESLELHENGVDLLEVLHDRLHLLRELIVREGHIDLVVNLSKIKLYSLESLEFGLKDISAYARVLKAMNQNKKINSLHLHCGELDDELITAICSFEMLVTLKIRNCLVTTAHMLQLSTHLPQLSTLSLKIESKTSVERDIFSVLSAFPKLKELTVFLPHYNEFLRDFKSKPMYDFHARLRTYFPNVVVNIESDFYGLVSTASDRILLCGIDSAEVHWMENANDGSVRQVLAKLRNGRPMRKLKFVNNCPDYSLDVSVLSVHPDIYRGIIHRLEIKSNGSISITKSVRLNFISNNIVTTSSKFIKDFMKFTN